MWRVIGSTKAPSSLEAYPGAHRSSVSFSCGTENRRGTTHRHRVGRAVATVLMRTRQPTPPALPNPPHVLQSAAAMLPRCPDVHLCSSQARKDLMQMIGQQDHPLTMVGFKQARNIRHLTLGHRRPSPHRSTAAHVHVHVPHITRRTPHATRHMPRATRRTQHAAYHTPHATRRTAHGTRNMPYTTRRTPHATRHKVHTAHRTPHHTPHHHTSHATPTVHTTRDQAQLLCCALRNSLEHHDVPLAVQHMLGATAIWSSPLTRALQTALVLSTL